MAVSKSLKDLSIGMANGTITGEKSMNKSLSQFNPGPSGNGEGLNINDPLGINTKMQDEITSAAGAESTILGTYNERRKLAETQGEADQGRITSQFNSAIEDQVTGGVRTLESTVEGESGFARHSLLFKNLAKDTREAVRDLMGKKEEALLLGQSESAKRIDQLILDQETALSAARTRYTDLLFKSADEIRSQSQEGRAKLQEERDALSFETPEQKRAAEFESKKKENVMNIMTNAPDAGILETDDFNTAITKYRNSATYKRDVTKGEQEIELMRANIAKAWADKAQTDAQIAKINADIANIDTGDPQKDAMVKYRLEKATGAVTAVDRAIRIFDEMKGGWTETGPVGRSLSQFVPGSETKDLEGAITEIQSIISFNELQSMRAASPTGGALGQVAVQELEMLQAALGSLDIGQSNEVLAENLNRVRMHYQNWLDTMNEAYGDKTLTGNQTVAPKGLDQLGKQFLQTQTSTPSGT